MTTPGTGPADRPPAADQLQRTRRRTRTTMAVAASTTWSTRVSFRGVTDAVLTIVASTGGHLLGVERFAITAIRS